MPSVGLTGSCAVEPAGNSTAPVEVKEAVPDAVKLVNLPVLAVVPPILGAYVLPDGSTKTASSEGYVINTFCKPALKLTVPPAFDDE